MLRFLKNAFAFFALELFFAFGAFIVFAYWKGWIR